jgi:hypothetical protein
MGLRRQILSSTERMTDIVQSAEHRFREGESLLRVGHFDGAVYLLGLSSEMYLKLAVFRYLGSRPLTAIASLFGPARAWMHTNAPHIDPESFHSLRFWAEYLIRIRSARHQPLSISLTGDLRHHVVNRLFEDWKIEMRYRAPLVSNRHATRVYNDASWLRTHWNHLWR